MSVTPKEFVKRFETEYPNEQLTYEKILSGTGLKDLQKAYLRNASLRAADLTLASLQGADLRGADLWEADFRDADLRNVDLRVANLQGANFQFANLRGATLWGANLQGADLLYANLQGANLRGTSPRDADFQGADLRGADLSDADLRYTSLRHVNLQGADLRGANLWNNSIFQLRGLPSGEVILYPTPDGWHLWVGCWKGTLEELKTLVAGDKWPRAKGEEIVTRRALFEHIFPLFDHHLAQNAGVIEELAEKWSTENKGETG